MLSKVTYWLLLSDGAIANAVFEEHMGVFVQYLNSMCIYVNSNCLKSTHCVDKSQGGRADKS